MKLLKIKKIFLLILWCTLLGNLNIFSSFVYFSNIHNNTISLNSDFQKSEKEKIESIILELVRQGLNDEDIKSILYNLSKYYKKNGKNVYEINLKDNTISITEPDINVDSDSDEFFEPIKHHIPKMSPLLASFMQSGDSDSDEEEINGNIKSLNAFIRYTIENYFYTRIGEDIEQRQKLGDIKIESNIKSSLIDDRVCQKALAYSIGEQNWKKTKVTYLGVGASRIVFKLEFDVPFVLKIEFLNSSINNECEDEATFLRKFPKAFILPKLYGTFNSDDRNSILMEFIEGETLFERAVLNKNVKEKYLYSLGRLFGETYSIKNSKTLLGYSIGEDGHLANFIYNEARGLSVCIDSAKAEQLNFRDFLAQLVNIFDNTCVSKSKTKWLFVKSDFNENFQKSPVALLQKIDPSVPNDCSIKDAITRLNLMLLDPQELLKQKNISDFLEENRKNAKIQKLIKQLAKSSKSDYGELQSAYLSRKLLETIFPQEMPLIQVDYKNKYIYILGMIEGIISRDDQEIDISEIYKKYIAPILIESEKEEDKKIHDHLLHFVIEKQLFRFLDKKSREIIDKLFVEKINYNEDYGMKLLRKINTSV